VEKRKKDLRKWEEIRTEDQLDSLQYVEEQIKFLKDVRARWYERMGTGKKTDLKEIRK